MYGRITVLPFPRGGRVDTPRLSGKQLAFLIGVPLAWAVLLLFHPIGSGDLYDEVRDEVTRWQVVHVGTLFFIGLMGLAVYLLVHELPGTAARVSRWAAAVFVLFYGAWEAVAGLAVGALVQYTNGLPPAERSTGSDAIESLNDNAIVGDFGLLGSIGALAWITAVIAAAFAVRRAGAPLAAAVLLGLSAILANHPPPTGPIGLVFFAAAVVLIARAQPARRPVEQTTAAALGTQH
jgi:hypothetical protein